MISLLVVRMSMLLEDLTAKEETLTPMEEPQITMPVAQTTIKEPMEMDLIMVKTAMD